MSDGNEPRKDERQVGRDEMNLCEFPITLVAERVPKGCKTLVFEGQHGKLTVTGGDAYGLPTAPDADVIIGLIQLTKLRNDFTDPAVPFTRYELLKLLGWPDQGWEYRRLSESLRRWVGVTLYYNGCWWDNHRRRRVDASFHILDNVTMFDDDGSRTPSSFTWNKVFFKSCRAGNLKRLDLDTYFSLKSAISKQTYRFLDKRFYVRGDWTFDLEEFAFEHVGLSRNYTAAKVKEKLKPALEELEGIGFLAPMTTADRYTKISRGAWRIRLVRKLPASVEIKPEPELEPTSLERELIDRGVTRGEAVKLVRDFPKELIRAKVEQVDWLREERPKKIGDVGAYLAEAIRKDYAPPAGFLSKAERAEAEATARTQQERREQARRTEARRQEEQARIASYWQGLTPEQRARLDAEALEQADPALRAELEGEKPSRMRRMFMTAIREDHIRHLLALPTATAG